MVDATQVAASLLAIAQAAGEARDLTESLRRVCRELSRLTGAETVSAHLRDPATDELRGVAAYHVPPEALEALAAASLPLAEQGFTADVFEAGAAVWTDDVPHDPRFVSPLFRQFPHQSGMMVPLVLDREPAGLFYLVWWRERRRPDAAELATLQAVAGQVGTLLRMARMTRALGRRNELLARAAQVSQRISSALELDAVLAEIARASAWLVDVPLAILRRADERTRTLELGALSDEAWAAGLPTRHLAFGQGLTGWVAEHRARLDVPDILADGRLEATGWARAHGLRSFHGVPIAIGERLLAVLGLFGRRPIRLDPDEAEVLDVLVTHAATSIGNAQLFRESQARRRAAEALARGARVLAESLDLPTVTHHVVQSVRPTLGVASAGIRLLEPDGSLRLVAADEHTRTVYDIGHVIPSGTGATGRAIRENRSVASRDMPADPAMDFPADARRLIAAAGFRAILATPLRVKGEAVGALYVSDLAPRDFSADEVAVFEAFADHASVAIQHAWLYESATTRAERQQTLVEISQLLSSSLDVDRLLHAIARAAATLSGASLASVWVADESRRTLNRRASSDPAVGASNPVETLAFGEGGVGWIAANREPLIVDDAIADGRIAAPHWRRQHALRSFYGVPVMVERTLVAVLALSGGRPFRLDPDQSRLLDGFVAQVATALRNAGLYQDALRQAQRTQALASMGQFVSDTLDSGLVAQRIADTLRPLLGVVMAVVYEVDDATHDLRVLAVSGEARFVPGIGQALPHGAGVVGRAVEERRPVMTADVLGDPRMSLPPEIRQRIEAADYRAALACPLVIQGRIIGALGVGDRKNRHFSPEDVALVQAFANQAAIALRNAALYAAERAAREESEQAMDAVLEREGRLRALVDDSPIGVLVVQDGIVRFANAAFLELMGYGDAPEVVGQPYWAFLAPHERARVEAFRQTMIRGGDAPGRHETENVRKDGTSIWVENWATPVMWRGAPADLVTFVDITERRRAQEAVKEREEQLRQTQKLEAIGKLAGGVAHDFNNVLAVIMGHADLLGDRAAHDPTLAEPLGAITGAAQRGARLTRQLLTFSRKQVLRPRVLDLNDVVGGLEKMLHRLIGEDVQLTSALAPDAGRVEADAGQLEQVVMNLVVNARDAMPTGGELGLATASVVLDGEAAGALELPPGPYAELTVSDTGVGMSPEIQAHIFEPFFTTKGPGQGTGLGLSTVYGIVRQSGGAIRVDSQPGLGTTFRIYMPRIDRAAEPLAPVVRERPRGSGETILVAEDEPEVRSLMAAVLATAGYQVLEACDGVEAQEVAARHPGAIDLLATDVIMPRMSGPELARRLVPTRPGLRVLYVSGYTADALGQHGVLASSITLIEKPFATDVLLRTVRRVLDGH